MPSSSIATFSSDATPPLGAPILGSACSLATTITDPLEVHGLVLLGHGQPIVIACVDWTAIGCESYARWRAALAEAAGTVPQRVLLSTIHQHGAPMDGHGAQVVMNSQPDSAAVPINDEVFHAKAMACAAAALREAMKHPQPVTRLGLGEAKVERFASNRRLLGPDGKVKAMRHSSSKKVPHLRDEPEGLIDPMLKMISFWNDVNPVAALSCYGTHPMSFYGNGEVTYDAPGLARTQLNKENPSLHHIYATGCGGNIAAGKYNDGSEAGRVALTQRLYDAMKQAMASTKTMPLERAELRTVPLPLEPRRGPGFEDAEMRALVADPSAPCYERARAAYFLAYKQWHTAGHRLELPVLDLGAAIILLLPGEPFIEYQLAAQQMRPDKLVMVIGYGDYAPVYIPTERAFDEGGYEPGDWAFVGRGCEAVMMEAMRKALVG